MQNDERQASRNLVRINAPFVSVPIASPENVEGFLELVFEPSLRIVELTRRYVEDLYGGRENATEASSALSVTAHELLENLAKHASPGDARFSVRVSYKGGRPIIAVRTRNKANADRIEKLRKVVAGIESANDPRQHYTALLRASRMGGDVPLGLARVRADSNLVLSIQQTREEVTVMANSR